MLTWCYKFHRSHYHGQIREDRQSEQTTWTDKVSKMNSKEKRIEQTNTVRLCFMITCVFFLVFLRQPWRYGEVRAGAGGMGGGDGGGGGETAPSNNGRIGIAAGGAPVLRSDMTSTSKKAATSRLGTPPTKRAPGPPIPVLCLRWYRFMYLIDCSMITKK